MVDGGAFIGEVEPFENFRHADLGSLVAVLRNGAPHSVHAPGKRLVRGLGGLPLVGDLQVIQVRTTPLVVHQTIQNIATTEPPGPDGRARFWEIPALSLGLSVQVNPDGDYRSFRDHVRQFGASFGGALLDELSAGLDDIVRQRLAPYGHEALLTAPLASLILPTKYQRLGGGALRLVSVVVESVTWSPWFLQQRSGIAQTETITAIELHRTTATEQVRVAQARSDAQVRTVEARTDAEAREVEAESDRRVRLAQLKTDTAVRTAQVRADAEVLVAGLDYYEEGARKLGISAYHLLHPEQLKLQQDRAERLLGLLREPGIRAYFQRDPMVLRALMAQASGATGVSAGASSSKRALEDGADAIRAMAAEPLELNRSPRLRRAVVRAVPSLQGLTGLSAGVDGARAIVLLVADGPLVDEPAMATLTSVLAPLLHVDRVAVLVLVAESLDEVVTDWFDAVHPGSGLRAQVEVDEQDVVVVEVRGDVAAARAAVAELDRPGNAAVEALADLLPHAAVSVRLGS